VASWSEIERIRKDPKGFRALAKRLRTHGDELTDWERDFLTSIQNQRDKDEFTNRQSEKLMQIRNDYEIVTKLPLDLSVRLVLAECVQNRAELPEDREQWVLRRHAQNPTSIRRKDIGLLMWCGRRVGAVDPEPTD
jgi:hypothetical protein